MNILEKIKEEEIRQKNTIELIASENFCSKDIMEACGSVLTNKYAEGYPGKRYYSGCEIIDEIEQCAIDEANKLFGSEYANVQPHSGAIANLISYKAFLRPGDKIMGMSLDSGGHLTHGMKLNFSGHYYKTVGYNVDKNGLLDYDNIEFIARRSRPHLIVAGASAYPREIDFKRFKEIADKYNAYLLADISHIAGLVAAKHHQSPIKYADVITTTTHKTLRGPRGAIILSNEDNAKKINSATFPGIQGGPLEHIIAGKAICLQEAQTISFERYIEKVIENSKVLANEFINDKQNYFNVISGGTDNHLSLIDLSKTDITGKDAEKILYDCKISVNKNIIPNDKQSPFITSGIRIGSAAMTTKGYDKNDMKKVASFMSHILLNHKNKTYIELIKKDINEFISIKNRGE